MPTRRLALAALAAAVLATGCNESCPTATPEVQAVANCTAAPGAVVSIDLRLCPTCNQILTSCSVELVQGQIFLDPLVEACDSAVGCGSCQQTNEDYCTVVAPAAPGPYQIQVIDPVTEEPRTGTLTVEAGAPSSCAFPTI